MGNLRNGQIRFDQQLFCVSNAFLDNIVVAGGICKLLKEPGKMKLGEAGKRSQFVYGNAFGAVLGNVVSDVHDLSTYSCCLLEVMPGNISWGLMLARPSVTKKRIIRE